MIFCVLYIFFLFIGIAVLKWRLLYVGGFSNIPMVAQNGLNTRFTIVNVIQIIFKSESSIADGYSLSVNDDHHHKHFRDQDQYRKGIKKSQLPMTISFLYLFY